MRLGRRVVQTLSGGLLLLCAACSKEGGAFAFGGAAVPEPVIQTAIRMHTLARGSRPIENLTVRQVTRASAEKAAARTTTSDADDDARLLAHLGTKLNVSAADTENGVEERVGILWRGIGRREDGTAEDVREMDVATHFRGGVWALAGFLLRDNGALAGTGDYAGSYRAEERDARGTFRCDLTLAPSNPATFRGTYRCAGQHRNYTNEPYTDVRYEGTIEEFVELAWTPQRFAAAQNASASCCADAFVIARAASGAQSLVAVEVRKNGDLDVPWNLPSRVEQGPSRTSSWRLRFQRNDETSGGGR